MIQDIAPKHLDNAYRHPAPRPGDAILAFQGRAICLSGTQEVSYPSFEDLQAHCAAQGLPLPDCQYLFSIDAQAFFLAELGDLALPGCHYENIFGFRYLKPVEQILAGATGWHLHTWYRANRFCGACGGPVVHDERERMLRCPACGNMIYPKINPAVIVGVTHGSRLLMTKYAGREYKRYALIAGFAEIGEEIEETVRREVQEEVGLRVKNLRYYKSQPWGFDGLLLMGFFAEAAEPLMPITMDEEELAVAEWVEAADIKFEEPPISLTGEMIQAFRARALAEAKAE